MSSKLDQLIEDYHSLRFESKITESIELCKEILKINPNLMEYQEELASSYYDTNEYEKSIDQFNKYIEKGGDKDFSLLMIALSYVKLNNIEKAFESIEQTEDKENYFLNHLKIYEELGDYDNAIEYGDRLLDINPENTWGLHIMSTIYEDIEDEERSLFYFNEFANIVPQFKPAEILRLYSLGKYDELIETFEEYRESGIFNDRLEDETFTYILGLAYYELERPYESLKYLLESDRLKEDVSKKMGIAKNYINLNKFGNAQKYLLDALKIDELDETCLFLITETSYYRGEYLQAIEYANKLLNNYQYDKTFHVLGAIYLEMGEIETAFENIKLGTNLMIRDAEYEYDEYILEIASRLSKAGLSKRAENIYNTLQRKFPNLASIYLGRAKHYKRIGKDKLSKKDFEKYNQLMIKEEREWREFLEKIDYM